MDLVALSYPENSAAIDRMTLGLIEGKEMPSVTLHFYWEYKTINSFGEEEEMCLY